MCLLLHILMMLFFKILNTCGQLDIARAEKIRVQIPPSMTIFLYTYSKIVEFYLLIYLMSPFKLLNLSKSKAITKVLKQFK